MQIATIGGGCFWCLDAIFLEIKGVQKVISGYSGGVKLNPTYQDICTGTTQHAEVIQVHFDEKEMDYKNILNIFFDIHDPTTLNMQGGDIGTQYRSVIYYHDKEQEDIATKITTRLNKEVFDNKVVTKVEPLGIFYKAEDYHQNYYKNNMEQNYCTMVIAPKILKFKTL